MFTTSVSDSGIWMFSRLNFILPSVYGMSDSACHHATNSITISVKRLYRDTRCNRQCLKFRVEGGIIIIHLSYNTIVIHGFNSPLTIAVRRHKINFSFPPLPWVDLQNPGQHGHYHCTKHTSLATAHLKLRK